MNVKTRVRASELRAGDVIVANGAVVTRSAYVNGRRRADFDVRYPSGQRWNREWNPRTEVVVLREVQQ